MPQTDEAQALFDDLAETWLDNGSPDDYFFTPDETNGEHYAELEREGLLMKRTALTWKFTSEGLAEIAAAKLRS